MAVYAIMSVTPVVDTMTHYPYHVIRCGGLPVVASGFAAAMSYNVPGDRDYAVTPFDGPFFCTEKEAKAADFHHYDDDFRPGESAPTRGRRQPVDASPGARPVPLLLIRRFRIRAPGAPVRQRPAPAVARGTRTGQRTSNRNSE